MSPSSKNAKILMVDDVERFQLIYELALKEEFPNASVEFATNGIEAMEKLKRSSHFDLVILDLNMPKLDGEKTLIRLKSEEKFSTLPILILTGESSPQVKQRLLAYGAHDFIEKGSDPDVFVGRVNAAMQYKLLTEELTDTAINNNLFSAGILHDIKNLETNITSLCHIIKLEISEKSQPCTDLQLKQTLLEEFSHLHDQANRLGEYARSIIGMIRTKDHAIKLGSLRLDQIFDWAFSLLLPRKPTLKMDIEQLQSVIGNNDLLRVAIFNILQNSVKFSNNSNPKIYVYQKPSEKGVTTYIEDNGPGLMGNNYAGVFEIFNTNSNDPQSGHGLGLSLVARSVRLMNGRVWARQATKNETGFSVAFELPATNEI